MRVCVGVCKCVCAFDGGRECVCAFDGDRVCVQYSLGDGGNKRVIRQGDCAG